MNSIRLPKYSVNYDFRKYRDVTLYVYSNCPALSTSGTAFIASNMANVNLLYDSMIDKFSVIFDNMAILAISFDKNDYFGPIIPLSNHGLGGLANGLNIEGIGTVK